MSTPEGEDEAVDAMIGADAAGSQKDTLKLAAKGLERALNEWRGRVGRATWTVGQARADHERRIKQLQAQLEAAGKPRKISRGVFTPVTLFDDRLVANGHEHMLDAGVSAVVDTAGNLSRTRRYTATRFALLGPLSLFAPKGTKHDDRELFLMIEGPDWAELVKCNKNQQAAVRSLAQQINLAARTIEQTLTTRRSQTTELRQSLETARGDTAATVETVAVRNSEVANRAAVEEAIADLCERLGTYPDKGSRVARKAAELVRRAQQEIGHEPPLPPGLGQLQLEAGSNAETAPFWPPPPPGTQIATEPPPRAVGDPTTPPFWPPPPGWTPTPTEPLPVSAPEAIDAELSQPPTPSTEPQSAGGTLVTPERKTCPDCAEEVKAAARVCRFCGYRFDGGEPMTGGPSDC